MDKNYERVNFGKYLENLRVSHKISIDELSEGLCDRSLITKIESGERVSTMLLRDRLIERCGATSFEYEKYVKVEEFEKWKMRASVIANIEEQKIDEAKTKLEEYKKKIAEGKKSEEVSLEEQFYLDIMAMIAKLEGSSEAPIFAEKALRKTVEIDQEGFVSSSRLSPKEINLAIEYSRRMEKNKRYEQLERLHKYAEEKELEIRNKVLFYPKLVFELISERIDEYKDDSKWLAWALELSDRASRLLADTNRLIYILELAEIKRQLWEYILALPDCIRSVGYVKLLEEKAINDNEYALWGKIGLAFGVEMHTISWSYIHYEEGVKCIGEVIKKRRTTIGMSREDLCEGICSLDSLKRCESMKGNLHPQKMLQLFERLGLRKEYQNTFVTVYNSDAKRIEERIMKLSNAGAYDEALAELHKLDRILISKTLEDKQFIFTFETMICIRKKEISSECGYSELYKALMLTLPIHYEVESYYLTRMEYNCVYNMVVVNKGKVSNIIEKLIIDICERQRNDESLRDVMLMELYMLALIKIYLAQGNYKEAEKCGNSLIRIELVKKRNATIYQALNEKILIYKKIREIGEEDIEEQIVENEYFIEGIFANKQTNKHMP